MQVTDNKFIYPRHNLLSDYTNCPEQLIRFILKTSSPLSKNILIFPESEKFFLCYSTLIYLFFLCHYSFYPMSSINHPKIRVKKRCFFALFLLQNRPKTTICCGQSLSFLFWTTIRHQNYTLNVAREDRIDVIWWASMREHINRIFGHYSGNRGLREHVIWFASYLGFLHSFSTNPNYHKKEVSLCIPIFLRNQFFLYLYYYFYLLDNYLSMKTHKQIDIA